MFSFVRAVTLAAFLVLAGCSTQQPAPTSNPLTVETSEVAWDPPKLKTIVYTCKDCKQQIVEKVEVWYVDPLPTCCPPCMGKRFERDLWLCSGCGGLKRSYSRHSHGFNGAMTVYQTFQTACPSCSPQHFNCSGCKAEQRFQRGEGPAPYSGLFLPRDR